MRRVLWLTSGILTGFLLMSTELWADVASRLCPGSIGCLITDGVDICLDSDRDGVPCENTEPNLTMNAPVNAAGDETVQGDLDVAGDLTVTGNVGNKRFTAQFGTRATGLAVMTSANCVTINPAASVTGCTAASASAEAQIVADVPITIREATCCFSRVNTDPWDGGDQYQVCLKEMGSGASGNCMTGTTFTAFTNASTQGICEVLTPNVTTSLSTDHGVSIGWVANATDTGSADSGTMACRVIYDIP